MSRSKARTNRGLARLRSTAGWILRPSRQPSSEGRKSSALEWRHGGRLPPLTRLVALAELPVRGTCDVIYPNRDHACEPATRLFPQAPTLPHYQNSTRPPHSPSTRSLAA